VPDSASTPRRPLLASTPSWSWISSNRSVVEQFSLHKNDSRYVEKAVVLAVLLESTPSGGFQYASLELQCCLIPLTFIYGDGERTVDFLCDSLSHCKIIVYPDDEAQADTYFASVSEASVVLLRYGRGADYYAHTAGGIVVAPCNSQARTYRRFGYCDMNEHGDGTQPSA
jgi:hypothetical protein